MTKTDLYGSCMAREICASDPHAAATRADHFDQIWFSYILFEKLSPEPKNGLESWVSRFSTMWMKNQALKLKIDKVTVILDLNSPFLAPLPCSIHARFLQKPRLPGWRGAYSTVDQFSAHLSKYWNLETCALKFGAHLSKYWNLRLGAHYRCALNFTKF